MSAILERQHQHEEDTGDEQVDYDIDIRGSANAASSSSLSRDLVDAVLAADEDAEDAEEFPEQVAAEIDASFQAQHRQRQQQELMEFIARSLNAQGGSGTGTRGTTTEQFNFIQRALQEQTQQETHEEDDEEDDEEEDEEEEEEARVSAFLSFIRSSLPSSLSNITLPGLIQLSRYWVFRVGRWSWNITTFGLLIGLPWIIASTVEEQKIAESNELMKTLWRLQSLEGKPGTGLLDLNPVVAAKAPAGYTPPPMEMSGIPQQ